MSSEEDSYTIHYVVHDNLQTQDESSLDENNSRDVNSSGPSSINHFNHSHHNHHLTSPLTRYSYGRNSDHKGQLPMEPDAETLRQIRALERLGLTDDYKPNEDEEDDDDDDDSTEKKSDDDSEEDEEESWHEAEPNDETDAATDASSSHEPEEHSYRDMGLRDLYPEYQRSSSKSLRKSKSVDQERFLRDPQLINKMMLEDKRRGSTQTYVQQDMISHQQVEVAHHKKKKHHKEATHKRSSDHQINHRSHQEYQHPYHHHEQHPHPDYHNSHHNVPYEHHPHHHSDAYPADHQLNHSHPHHNYFHESEYPGSSEQQMEQNKVQKSPQYFAGAAATASSAAPDGINSSRHNHNNHYQQSPPTTGAVASSSTSASPATATYNRNGGAYLHIPWDNGPSVPHSGPRKKAPQKTPPSSHLKSSSSSTQQPSSTSSTVNHNATPRDPQSEPNMTRRLSSVSSSRENRGKHQPLPEDNISDDTSIGDNSISWSQDYPVPTRANPTNGKSNSSSAGGSGGDSLSPRPSSAGVGFVIGSVLTEMDATSEISMAKKKEMIIIHSLNRKAEQEAKRLKKQEEMARKREEEDRRREEQERKREEAKIRKQKILEEYKMKKAAEDEKLGGWGPPGNHNSTSASSAAFMSKDSGLGGSGGTVVFRTRGQNSRPFSAPNGPKSRPKSIHVDAASTFMPDLTFFDKHKPSVPRLNESSAADATDDAGIDSLKHHNLEMTGPNYGRKNTLISYMTTQPLRSGGYGTTRSAFRPSSALSASSQNLSSSHSASTGGSSAGMMMPSMPHLFRNNNYSLRKGGPESDSSSDVASLCSGYNGPKLFVKPSQKSNRGIILNAINVVLAGSVNADTKTKVLEELGKSDGKHFLILFRGAGLQFRGIYCYYVEHEMAVKLHGTGPKTILNEMIDKFFKYNSGSKRFVEIQTKHLSITIDGFTIHNQIWSSSTKKCSFTNLASAPSASIPSSSSPKS